ncbi:hypothetical protein [Singulisphaera sp. PoT]|uniref:hypothetical protein n=1 Tax=Singulisphaera sp. PoT TaxID=3411797 RepID=UPI003BF5D195
MEATSHHVTGSFATVGGVSLWTAFNLLQQYGPSWSVVPPLLAALASLYGVLNERKRLRIREAELKPPAWFHKMVESDGKPPGWFQQYTENAGKG